MSIASFEQVLEIKVQVQDNDEIRLVDYKLLHTALDIKTPAKQWFARLLEKYKFEEGEDYVTVRFDLETVEGRKKVGLNNGSTVDTYLLTLDMAKEICMMQATPLGKSVRKYFITAEKVAVKYAKQELMQALQETKQDLRLTEKLKNQFADEVTTLAKAQGFTSASSWEQQLQLAERSRKINDQRVEATNAALLLWEQASRALRALKNGQNNAAKMELQQVLDQYGMYDDFLRDNPPWSQHND
jgi:phage anti-repressor protein